MAEDSQRGYGKRKAVEEEEEDLEAHDEVDEAAKDELRELGMFFDDFGEVVKARSWRIVIRAKQLRIESPPAQESKRMHGEWWGIEVWCRKESSREILRHTNCQCKHAKAHCHTEVSYER